MHESRFYVTRNEFFSVHWSECWLAFEVRMFFALLHAADVFNFECFEIQQQQRARCKYNTFDRVTLSVRDSSGIISLKIFKFKNLKFPSWKVIKFLRKLSIQSVVLYWIKVSLNEKQWNYANFELEKVAHKVIGGDKEIFQLCCCYEIQTSLLIAKRDLCCEKNMLNQKPCEGQWMWKNCDSCVRRN